MTVVLVTGATGFVGRVACDALTVAGYAVRAAVRAERPPIPNSQARVVVREVGADTDWGPALDDVEFVIHLAATAHVAGVAAANATACMEVNARGTAALATASVQAGVRRFVYLSSVKVNGEGITGHAYSPQDEPHPSDAYAVSKWLGEQHLLAAAENARMEVVIIRSPLVYGSGVRANFLRLLQWVNREWPLPLGAVQNTRSLVSVWNLCDLLTVMLGHPAAAGRTWMVSDGEDLSTPELIRRLGRAMNRRVRLWRVAPTLLQICGASLGQREAVARLCGSLAVDSTYTRRELGWSPPLSVDEGLARTSSWYLAEGHRGV
jgi:nucleoside-diphosphate-sugar epimerase